MPPNGASRSSNGASHGAFGENPLSLSLGASDFQQWVKHRKHAEHAPSSSERAVNGRPSPSASRPSDGNGRNARSAPRYKTPYMTTDDLRKAPRSWREFLCTDHVRASYSIPRSVEEAKVRLDGNAFDYVGNYTRMGVVFGCCVLYRNPTAIVGAVATAKMYRWMDRNIAATSEMQALKMLGSVIAWFVMMYTKASSALSTTIVLTMGFLLAHGCLRRRDAPKPVKMGRHIGISKWEMQSPRKSSR